MRNRKNCLAVLLMTTIVVMGCGNQQVEKENSSAVSERASSVQDESEDGEKEFLSTYQNIIITLPEGWNVMRDEKIQCSFISEDGESLEISYREGMAKVILMDFPEDEESACCASSMKLWEKLSNSDFRLNSSPLSSRSGRRKRQCAS